jgi:hypothetical protein
MVPLDGGMVRRIRKRNDTMQTIEQMNLEPRALTDAELDQISGGGILSRIGNFLKSIFSGPGDLRRPTDRPN